MTFPGRFRDSLVVEQLDKISVSFLVDDLDVRRGGVAANIAFGMANLGLRPSLVGAVGEDFLVDYRSWLERHGVDCASIHVSAVRHTARFVCTTDTDHAQMASFYPGAMSEARDIELAPLARDEPIDLVIVSPTIATTTRRISAPTTRRRCTATPTSAAAAGSPLPLTPASSWPGWTGRASASSSTARPTCSATSTRRPSSSRRPVGAGTTLGKNGVRIESKDADPVHDPVATEVQAVDPTGVGDAFRAGFFSGIAWGLSHERAAQVGSLLATYVIETVGTQEYSLRGGDFLHRLWESYGDEVAADVEPHLKPVHA